MEHRRFNRPQRVVAVVAIGFALYSLGAWMVTLGSHIPYGSATYTSESFSNTLGGLHPWVQFTMWILLIAIWVGVSIPLLGERSKDEKDSFSPK
jgi:hypothetical protein